MAGGQLDTSDSKRPHFRQRPYCVEYTRSHPNSEVKRRKARIVLGWGTAWEVLRVPLAFLWRIFLCAALQQVVAALKEMIEFGALALAWVPQLQQRSTGHSD